MIPHWGYTKSKFHLLEAIDIIKEGDEYYDPFEDIWRPVTNGEPEIDEQTGEEVWPDSWIGYNYEPDDSKPVRRRNPLYVEHSELNK